MIRVIIAEDHDILREGLQVLLSEEPTIKVVADAPNGKVLLDYLETTPADLVLMDINMPVMNGFEATKIISREYSHIKVLVLSMLDHPYYYEQMTGAGAKGYVLKSCGKKELIHAIREVAAGRKYVSKEILDNCGNDSGPSSHKPPEIKLTKRETQILEMLAEGLTSKEIAERIFLSKRTVESHRRALLEKTKCKNSNVLIRYAISHGMLNNNREKSGR